MTSRSDSGARSWKSEGLREFTIALALLAIALFFALLSQSAATRGDGRQGVLFSLAALLLLLTIALTVVPRLARRVNFSRWLIPFSVSITREGGLYILGVLLVSLAAINTGNNLLFLILATLLSAIIASGVIARISLRSIVVSMQVPENVFEGERVSVKVSLSNHKRLFPSFSISIEDRELIRPVSGFLSRIAYWRAAAPDEGAATQSVLRQSAYFPVVLPRETRSELVSQHFPKRGAYRLDGFRISTRFPFGFFKRAEVVRATGEVLVYPSVHELSGYFHLLPFLPGQLEGLRVGHGESLYAIRKYQESDSARLVDWKATAKTGDLMSREYARDEESKFCLILDTFIPQPKMEGFSQQFEKAVSLAASLAVHFSAEDAELEFVTPQEHIPRASGIEHLYRILSSLAVVCCRDAPSEASRHLRGELSGIVDPVRLQQILSDKVFKIIITPKPRGSFSSTVWRSSHVVYFDEL